MPLKFTFNNIMKLFLQKYSIVSGFLLVIICMFSLNRCIVKELNPRSGEPGTTPGLNLSTIPGNNYFKVTTSGIAMFSASFPGEFFNSFSGKCDTAKGRYIISMESSDSGRAFASVFLIRKPEISTTLSLVPFETVPLSDTSAWITAAIVKRDKVWRAMSGKLLINVIGEEIEVSFDTAKVECIGNFTDTTYNKMSGRLFCK